MRTHFFIIISVLLLVSCASSGRQGPEGSTASYVSGADLRATGHSTLEAALRDIRPRWLNLGRESAGFTRSGTIEVCRGNLFVYIDGERTEEPLNSVPVTNIEGVQFIRSAGLRPDGYRSCPEIPAVNVIMRDEGT